MRIQFKVSTLFVILAVFGGLFAAFLNFNSKTATFLVPVAFALLGLFALVVYLLDGLALLLNFLERRRRQYRLQFKLSSFFVVIAVAGAILAAFQSLHSNTTTIVVAIGLGLLGLFALFVYLRDGLVLLQHLLKPKRPRE